MRSPLGQKHVDRLRAFRTNLMDRVREVNQISEREVIAASNQIDRIVRAATDHIQRTHGILRELEDGGQEGLQGAVERQTAAVDAYARDLAERIEQQERVAEAAAELTTGITRAAASVEALTVEARVLALNARLEAARLGSSGSAFATIAGEMKRLSEQIAKTNELIHELAGELCRAVPEVAVRAVEMRRSSGELYITVNEAGKNVANEANALRQKVAAPLSDGDQALAVIVRASHEALSHLQFQDPVAQGLMRVEGWIVELLRDTLLDLDRSSEASDLEPPAHVNMGGDKPIETEMSGSVLFF